MKILDGGAWHIRRAVAIVGAILIGAVVLSPAGAARAAVTAEPEIVQVAMELDCAGMSDQALGYAVKNNLCTADRKVIHPDVGTLDTRWGTCGASHIYVWDQSGTSGRMVAGYGFLSILGTVVYRNLTIGWTNITTGSVGSSRDSGIMFSSSYGNERTLSTGNGWVFATLSGTVTLAWGGQCTLLIPADDTVVYSS